MPSVRDPFDSLRRKLQARRPRRIRAPAAVRTSVALILIPAPRRDFRVLLIERARRAQDPWSGQVALPGGRCEPADADRLATSIRETAEETGVTLRPEDLIGELDDLRPRTATYPDLSVRPFVFTLPGEPATAPSPEAAECFWVGLKDLRGSACTAAFKIAGKPRFLPAFRVDSRIVWGLTYRILTSLLEILAGRKERAPLRRTS